jgi:hypothetical protein
VVFSALHFRFSAALAVAILFCCATISFAQSTDPALPTPVSLYEINGTIRALDLGDSRQTRHYYAFNGTHGDLLVTVESRNLNGDVDIFTAVTLKPLMKIPMYAQTSSTITTKSIYMRAPEILILRIEARSPNDESGFYHVRFGGAFSPFSGGIPVAASDDVSVARRALTRPESRGIVPVSSVGARIEESPTPEPSASTPASETKTTEKPESEATKAAPSPTTNPARQASRGRQPVRGRPRRTPAPSTKDSEKTESKSENTKAEIPEEKPAVTKPAASESETKTPASVTQPGIGEPGAHLIIIERDGTRLDRPMGTVRRITIDNGVIIVFLKNGRIDRISMTDVERMSIEP